MPGELVGILDDAAWPHLRQMNDLGLITQPFRFDDELVQYLAIEFEGGPIGTDCPSAKVAHFVDFLNVRDFDVGELASFILEDFDPVIFAAHALNVIVLAIPLKEHGGRVGPGWVVLEFQIGGWNRWPGKGGLSLAVEKGAQEKRTEQGTWPIARWREPCPSLSGR